MTTVAAWIVVALLWVVLGGSALSLLGMGLLLASSRGSLDVHVFSVILVVGAVSCAWMLSMLHRVLRAQMEVDA